MKFLLILCLPFLFAARCSVTKAELDAEIWLHDQLPKEFCYWPDGKETELWKYGIYRRVGDKEEFIPYCEPAIKNYLSIHKTRYEEWLRRFNIK